MKYSVLGILGLVFASLLEAPAQAVKPTKPPTGKDAVSKKIDPAPQPAPPVVSTTLVVPSWLPPTNPVQPAATIAHDLLDTKLDVRFDWGRQWLLGTATLTVRPHFYPQTQLVLDAKGFDIKSVRLVTGNKEKNLTYNYDRKKITVNLDRQYPRTESCEVRIQYVAKPNELEVSGSDAIREDKGLYFINPAGTEKNKPRQVWTQGETESNSCWFPTIDRPNQRMTQEVSLTVEAELKTLSNGILVSSRKNNDGTRTDTWRQNLPHAPYLTMLAVGNFAVVSDTWRGKAVDYYVDPRFSNTAKAVFGRTPEMMEFFSKKLGVDFPWEKYAQVAVHDFVTGAMENTTAVTFAQNIVQFTARELPDIGYEPEATVAHELFHHWFGNYVTAESWANLPLNESFADYSEYLWAEYKYGTDAAALVQQQKLSKYLDEAQNKREPLVRYRYAKHEDMFDAHSYEKGARVLHMLRKLVGDDAFFTALNRYLTQNKFSSSEIAELRVAFEETTGEDLMWFFDQWFLQRGHPELKVSHSFAGGQVSLRVQQQQDSTFSPIYRLPVTITIWSNNQVTDYRVVVNKADQTFRFTVPQRPSLVKFDSESQLLAQIDEERTQEELLFQFSHARNYLQKYEAIDLLRSKNGELAVSGMLRNALSDRFWAVRQAAAGALRRYRGPEGNAVRQELRRVVTSDKKSQVRAAALATLAAFPNEDFGSTYLAALNDSSYRVVSAAVQALAKTPTVDARDKINALQETTSQEVLQALSVYYSLNGSTTEQYQWFLRRLPDATEETLYSGYLPNFATFMLRIPTIEREKGVQRLEGLARSAPSSIVRLGAYRGLSILATNMPVLKATMQDIRNKEKDEQVKAFYALMQ